MSIKWKDGGSAIGTKEYITAKWYQAGMPDITWCSDKTAREADLYLLQTFRKIRKERVKYNIKLRTEYRLNTGVSQIANGTISLD